MTFRPIDVSHLPPVPLRDQPAPVVLFLALADLVIDDRYQRPLGPANWVAIKRIAAAFDWARFAPLVVAPVEGGRFAVVDGQHRAHAAAVCGIKQVPAMVALIAPAQQAAAFIGINGSAIRVSGHQMYRAGLVAGEGWAVAACDAVAAGGCVLMTRNNVRQADKQPGEVYAIGLIRGLMDRGGAAAVTAGLRALRAVDEGRRVELYADIVLSPWLSALASDPTLLRLDLAGFLRSRSIWQILERADSLARAEGRPLGPGRRDAVLANLRTFGKVAA